MMKMSQFWPKSKAIDLVLVSNITKFDIDFYWSLNSDENEPFLAKN